MKSEKPIKTRVRGAIRGFDIEIEFGLERLSSIERAIDALTSLGLQPREIERDAAGLPLCPRHHVVMREREKQGDSWYSHRVCLADGREFWCRGRPGADSAGWYLLEETVDAETATR
jgi:hypothetical protein